MMRDLRPRDLRDSLAGATITGSDGTVHRLEQCIGTGGQGWVFRAQRGDNDDIVIVKVLKPDGIDERALRRFRREADVLRALSRQPDAHIVQFYDHGITTVRLPTSRETLPFAYTVLEYVDGPTLGEVLQESDEGLPFPRVRRILDHVAKALTIVHDHGVIHRDLKPSNILIAKESGEDIAKVTDFGLVRVADVSPATTGFLGVTHGYAPPELYEKANPRACVRSDVFSVAAIAWEMIAGQPVFPFGSNDTPTRHLLRMTSGRLPSLAQSERPSRELAAHPDALRAIEQHLARALAPDPEDRQTSVAELVGALTPDFSRP
jgi:serine/threonine-protein kinase